MKNPHLAIVDMRGLRQVKVLIFWEFSSLPPRIWKSFFFWIYTRFCCCCCCCILDTYTDIDFSLPNAAMGTVTTVIHIYVCELFTCILNCRSVGKRHGYLCQCAWVQVPYVAKKEIISCTNSQGRIFKPAASRKFSICGFLTSYRTQIYNCIYRFTNGAQV